MYFNKLPHIENFAFAQQVNSNGSLSIKRHKLKLETKTLAQDIFHLKPSASFWSKNHSQSELKRPPVLKNSSQSLYRLETSTPFGLQLIGPDNEVLLSSPAGMTFGVCGKRSIFVFKQTQDMQFYGMGEKMRGLELSGIHTKFWNTDIFADFHWDEIANGRPDPMYASVPYVILKRGNQYVGLLLDNPHATFMSCGESSEIGGGQMIISNQKEKFLTIGAENGVPELYIIVGPSLAQLTRKLQKLVGVTPLPPAWALGYHQCRWGYKSDACLNDLDEKFTRHGIPCDGLWVDIDYMDSFKVFSFNKDYFPSIDRTLKKIEKKGRKVVPIIDPGVKQQKGYNVYDSGKKADIFCKNPAGDDFVGLVWPGETVFPDYSMKSGRAWWANWVKRFAQHGFYGAWLDMNDPSTGPILNEDMLFNKGKNTHDCYHNQYALGMAKASREGFSAAHKKTRPFLLSRSGFTGISKYAALWTGDNMSNYHYLRNCIAVSMNLALSGIPFNGPDIGGFAGDATPQLLSDWMKTCFLFPFCRNHSMICTPHQEPWAFDERTLKTVKHFIQMRYKLRPYLYNLFIQQETEGEAILRPLFYDFDDTAEMPLSRIDDIFMVGPSILQAPLLNEHERSRDVVLPGKNKWFSVLDNTWLEGGQKQSVSPGPLQTALYLREGTIIPTTTELPEDNKFDGKDTAFHILLNQHSSMPVSYTYSFDDGNSYEYKKGKRSTLWITAKVIDNKLDIVTEYTETGFGKCKNAFVLYDAFDAVTINGKTAKTRKLHTLFAGSKITTWSV